MNKTKSSPFPPQLLKRVVDMAPADITLWNYGGNPKQWQECVMFYYNEETLRSSGAAFVQTMGLPAGQFLAGIEKTPVAQVLIQAVATQKPQEITFHFEANEHFPDRDNFMCIMPMPGGFAAYTLNITDRIQAEKAKAERIGRLEMLNQKFVERELQMIQLKGEIAELEKRMQGVYTPLPK